MSVTNRFFDFCELVRTKGTAGKRVAHYTDTVSSLNTSCMVLISSEIIKIPLSNQAISSLSVT